MAIPAITRGSAHHALIMARPTRTRPIALSIAGSDSGGGAGVQADLKVFHALRVHGTTAITCLTCQNPREVRAIQPARIDIVRQQITAVLDELTPQAVKTGMLYSAGIIRVVAALLSELKPRLPLVVDPVMVATSGAALLQPSAARALRTQLLPLATVITPNLLEAEALTGKRVQTPEELRAAARELHDISGAAVLVKGGHLKGTREAMDLFWDGRTELLLTAPFVRGIQTHGTGCTFSAAITGYLARGQSLSVAVQKAKDYITKAVSTSCRIGRHWTLG